MRKISSLLIMMGVAILSQTLFAQKTVTGKVTDEKNTPLSNVSIQVKGTSTGTTSKEDGSYSLVVPATGKMLVFSFVDMEPVEVTIGNQSVINTSLRSLEKALSEEIGRAHV